MKRVYEPASDGDGKRVLVDRLWPRGVTKSEANLDEWVKDLAPTPRLREWFHDDPARWKEFSARYRRELHSPGKQRIVYNLRKEGEKRTVTLLYGARDEEHNHARVLIKFLSQGKR